MSQTLQQESLIVALSKCAIKIGVEKIFGNFNCFCLEICFVPVFQDPVSAWLCCYC